MNAFMRIRKDIFKADQVEFAALIGVSQGTISRWESGKSRPRKRSLKKLEDIASERGKRLSKKLMSEVLARVAA